MKYGPLIAVIFGFFLIAIYPYYADDEPTVFVVSDDDEDGVPNDKDLCPEEDASGNDVDEDGCIDEEITKKEIDYIEKIAKFNFGSYILFAVLSLLGTAIYWERDRIRAVLYEEDDLDFSKLKEQESSDDIGEEVDYEELGKNRQYNILNKSYANFNFSFEKLNEEADWSTQAICVICAISLFAVLSSNFSWFTVEGIKDHQDSVGQTLAGRPIAFEAKHYSNKLEYSYESAKSISSILESDKTITSAYEWNTEEVSYDSSHCTEEIDEIYNCDYRKSLFGTMETLLSIALFFCFFALLLGFRAEKYRIWIATTFSITLVTSMASLLIFTALIDNALIADERFLDDEQGNLSGCWMSEPAIWGEEINCVSLESDESFVYESEINYAPGLSFYIVLICTSIMFVGLFTSISPMINMERTNWYVAIRNNWQIFAIVFFIVFLWRLNVLMNNL